MTIRTVLGNLLRGCGYHLVRVEALPTVNFSWRLGQLLTSQQIDTVLDVGANRGQYRDFLRDQVGYTGRIVSFEPVDHLHRALTARAHHDPQWHIQPIALGARNEARQINVMRSDDWSSFLEPRVEAGDRFEPLNRVASTQAVEVRRLDDVFPDLERTLGIRRAYLKLDTQGSDLAVMEGAATVLPRFVALQTEAAVIPYYAGMPTYREVIDHAQQAGFAINAMFPVSNDARLRLIEFDCLMVNPGLVRPIA
ncbi:MAG TPA: FkbM family methyltransferase [Dehalococcoidia bacterium]